MLRTSFAAILVLALMADSSLCRVCAQVTLELVPPARAKKVDDPVKGREPAAVPKPATRGRVRGEQPPAISVAELMAEFQGTHSGTALLHLDVPSGAIVTIQCFRECACCKSQRAATPVQPTRNRSWQRYRHFLIAGIKPGSSVNVVVRVGQRHDRCQCDYTSKTGAAAGDPLYMCDCGYDLPCCCKTVCLRAGDEEYLSFDGKPKANKDAKSPKSEVIFVPQSAAQENADSATAKKPLAADDGQQAGPAPRKTPERQEPANEKPSMDEPTSSPAKPGKPAPHRSADKDSFTDDPSAKPAVPPAAHNLAEEKE